MNILYDPALLQNMADSCLVIDTCVLIDASKNSELLKLLQELKKCGCELKTVSAAWVEFLRSARTSSERAGYRDFLLGLGLKCFRSAEQDQIFYPDGALFQLVLRQCKVKGPSYVDLLLLFMATQCANAKLVTSNHKDVPSEIFDVENIITTNRSGEFRTTGIYSFNSDHYKDIAARLS